MRQLPMTAVSGSTLSVCTFGPGMNQQGRHSFIKTFILTAACAAVPALVLGLLLCVTGAAVEKQSAQAEAEHAVALSAARFEKLLSQYAAQLRGMALAEGALAGEGMAAEPYAGPDAGPGTGPSAGPDSRPDVRPDTRPVARPEKGPDTMEVGGPFFQADQGDALRIAGNGQVTDMFSPGAVLAGPPDVPLQDMRAGFPSLAGLALSPRTGSGQLYLALQTSPPDSRIYLRGIPHADLRGSLQVSSLPEGAAMFLFSDKGEMLASYPDDAAIAPPADSPLMGSQAHAAHADMAEQENYGQKASGHEAYAAQAGVRMPEAFMPGYTVALTLPDTSAFATLLQRFSLFMAGLVLAGVSAAYLLRRRLSVPLADLLRTSALLSGGELSARARPGAGAAELQSLGACLNTLARRLDDSEHALRNAQRALEGVSEHKVGLLSNISHELRTPLNTIIGMAYLALRDEDMPPLQHGYLRRIHESGTDLQRILNTLLESSRYNRDEPGAAPSGFSIRDVFAEQYRHFIPLAREKGLELLYAPSSTIPQRLVGYPVRIGQIIGHLLNNALRYTEKGSVTVACDVETLGLSKAVLRITVTDTGPGMSRAQLTAYRRIFSSDTPLAHDEAGKGLGLLQAHRLTRLLGGAMSLRSKAGEGVSVSLRLEVGVRMQRRRQRGGAFLNGIRVLAVDGDPLSLAGIREILEKYGASVTTETAPENGLALLAAADADGKAFHCLILDWRMPELGGADMIKMLRSNEKLQKEPAIIMLCAYGWEGIHPQAQSSGVDAFLHKPVNETTLLDALALVLRKEDEHEAGEDGAVPEICTKDIAGMRVLVVEDNMLNQDIVRELLSEAGLKAQLADNGVKALEILGHDRQDAPFDLVLMDLQMPEMDGFEAARRIRKSQVAWLRDIPIIAMSAFSRDQAAAQALASGMDDYVSKPLDAADFYHTLARWKAVTPFPRTEKGKAMRELAHALGRGAPDVWERFEALRGLLLAHIHEGRVARLEALLASGKFRDAAAFLERLIDVLSQ